MGVYSALCEATYLVLEDSNKDAGHDLRWEDEEQENRILTDKKTLRLHMWFKIRATIRLDYRLYSYMGKLQVSKIE